MATGLVPQYPPPSEENWTEAVKILRRKGIVEPFPVPDSYTPLEAEQQHFHPNTDILDLPALIVCIECSHEACQCEVIVLCRLCQALGHSECFENRARECLRQNTRPCCCVCTAPATLELMRKLLGSGTVNACPAMAAALAERKEFDERQAEYEAADVARLHKKNTSMLIPDSTDANKLLTYQQKPSQQPASK